MLPHVVFMLIVLLLDMALVVVAVAFTELWLCVCCPLVITTVRVRVGGGYDQLSQEKYGVRQLYGDYTKNWPRSHPSSLRYCAFSSHICHEWECSVGCYHDRKCAPNRMECVSCVLSVICGEALHRRLVVLPCTSSAKQYLPTATLRK